MRHHFHSWMTHQSPDLYTNENLWDVLEMTLCSVLTQQDLGEKSMQHEMEINLVALQKLIEAVSQ